MKSLIKAAELLARRGLACKEMDMVLFAMLEEGYGYAEAVRAYVEFDGRSRTEVEGIMEDEARRSGHWTGARYILEDCYREAIRCELNIF